VSVRILEDHVVNQIAAGEVVERPASAVKELVENALDAQARTIAITLADGGRERVRVTDDGFGMDRDDAMMCLERHATSKILRAEDLLAVSTLGFRGEALPSIAAVSRFTLTTRRHDSDVGARIRVEGGTLRDVAPAGAAPGTTVDVRSLFYNLPARRKFMRSRATERHHCVEAVLREALGRPDVDFTVRHDDRELLRAPRAADRAARAIALLGPDARHLRPIAFTRGALQVDGLVGPPTTHRSTAAAAVYLYVNGRYVRDTLVRRAVYEAYRGYVPRGRYPLVVLDIRLEPARVDVNVHPTKTEVRFQDPMGLARALTDGVLEALGGRRRPEAAGGGGESPPLSLVSEASGPLFRVAAPPPPPVTSQLTSEPPRRSAHVPPDTVPAHPDDAVVPVLPTTAPEPPARLLRALRVIGALHGRFLLCEGPDGLVVVDRRRAEHARLTARLRRMQTDGTGRAQRLLAPVRLTLPPADQTRLLACQDLLSSLGVDLDAIGPVLVIRGLPDFLPAAVDVHALAGELASAVARGPDPQAVSAAIARVGSQAPLAELELYDMRALLAELDELGAGRAEDVSARLTIEELDQHFSKP
jgi:DNA mismatch repair protein MutL